MVHCIYLRGHRCLFPKYIVFLSLKIYFVLANIVDPDEMPHKFRMVHCIYLRGHRCLFPKYIVFLSLKIYFVLANIADPDEMPHYAAFHLGIQCVSKYPFRDFWSSEG